MQAFCFFALFAVVGRGLYAEFYGCVTYHIAVFLIEEYVDSWHTVQETAPPPTQEDKAHGKG